MRPSSRKISRSEVIMSSEDAAKREAAEVPVVQPEPGTESSNPSPSASESVTRRFRGWGEKARLSPERAHGTGSEKGTWWRRTGVFGPYFSGRALMQSPLGIRGRCRQALAAVEARPGSLTLSRHSTDASHLIQLPFPTSPSSWRPCIFMTSSAPSSRLVRHEDNRSRRRRSYRAASR